MKIHLYQNYGGPHFFQSKLTKWDELRRRNGMEESSKKGRRDPSKERLGRTHYALFIKFVSPLVSQSLFIGIGIGKIKRKKTIGKK